MTLDRRRFLKALGWTGAGLVVLAGGAAYAALPVLPHRADPTPADAAAWLRLDERGRVSLVLPRAEMGQGIAIALRQILSAASGVPLARIDVIDPRSDRLPPTRATVGSDSVRDFGPLVWRAGLALAEVIRAAGIDPAAAPDSAWRPLAARPRLIEADRIIAMDARPGPAASDGGAIGQALPTHAVETIVTASAPLYVDDVRLPGMVFAMPLDPRLTRSGCSASPAGLPGVIGVFCIEQGAFLVAERRGACERAVERLEADLASAGPGRTAADLVSVAGMPVDIRLEHSVLDEGGGVAGDLDLRLEVPMAAHAAIEPRCAVARPDSGGAITVFASTQDVTFAQAMVAAATGRRRDAVTVIGCRVGGGFGLKTVPIAECAAAQLADRVGRPVKLTFRRIDEFRHGFHRPPSSHRLRLRLAADGTVEAWQHQFRSGHVIFTDAAMGPALRFATGFVADPGAERGCVPPYAVGARRISFEDVRLPVMTGPWRGLGAAPNVWAIETAIDAAAGRAGEDPLAYRLRHLSPAESRLATCLAAVGAAADWRGSRRGEGRAFGLACGTYKGMAHAAVVAECRMLPAGPRVTRLWCVQDSGLIINPDQARAQVEGNLVFGLGMALVEELTGGEGGVTQSGFADYALPRFSDVPPMTIRFIGEDRLASGVGEVAIVAATAAITNALSALTGQRVTRLPWRAG